MSPAVLRGEGQKGDQRADAHKERAHPYAIQLSALCIFRNHAFDTEENIGQQDQRQQLTVKKQLAPSEHGQQYSDQRWTQTGTHRDAGAEDCEASHLFVSGEEIRYIAHARRIGGGQTDAAEKAPRAEQDEVVRHRAEQIGSQEEEDPGHHLYLDAFFVSQPPHEGG